MESKIERVKQEMASFFTTNPFLKSCNQFEWNTVKKSDLKKFVGNAKLVKAEEMGSGIYGSVYADEPKKLLYMVAFVDDDALILKIIFTGGQPA